MELMIRMFVMKIVLKITLLCAFFISSPVFSAIFTTTHSISITETSSLDILGRQDFVYAYDSSMVNVSSGAGVVSYSGYDNSKINITGGRIGVVELNDNSSAIVTGGDIAWFWLYDDSKVNIRSLEDLAGLFVDDQAEINIFGSGFSYSHGFLSGMWANGEPFMYLALEVEDFISGPGDMPFGNNLPDNIMLHVVSTPSTIFLFFLGMVFVVKGRNVKKLIKI